jgi:phage head maturation protease
LIEQVYLNNQGEFLVGIYEDKIIAIGAFRKVDEERAEIKM